MKLPKQQRGGFLLPRGRVADSGCKRENESAPLTFGSIALCVGAGLALAAIEIIFFTPVLWGGNQR
jgi:hypothetical protein